jgi:mannonate dehydratase
MTLPMRVGLGQFNELTDEKLQFIKQLGANDFLMNTPKLPGEHQWEYEDLADLRQRAESAELRLMALENVPISFYDKAMLGLPGRDEQIAHMQTTIRNMGRAGIPILGYHWMPSGVWRTQEPATLRGGAKGTRFDMAEHENAPLSHGRTFGTDEMWANYEYYMERVLPVAEEAGVKLALHPDDPPVPSLGGVARLFYNFAGFKRAMDTFDSAYHGLDFCMGCWSEMGGMESVTQAIRHFGERDKIIYVHFRDVQGEVPCFNECFIDEGNVEPFDVMRLLKEVGFTGFMICDHVPAMVDDTRWGHRGRAYAIGYMRALLNTVNKLYPN